MPALPLFMVYFILLFNDNSKTCVNGNTENNCLTCETDKFRIFNSNENSCLCRIEFYDNGQEKCILCRDSIIYCEICQNNSQC